MLVGPLVAHEGIGAFLAGVILAVIIEGYRRARRPYPDPEGVTEDSQTD